MCRVAKDRGRINSSAGRCLTLRCSQTLSTRCISVQGCGALSDAGQMCRGGYLGARVDLGHPWLGGVGMCTVRLSHPSPDSPPAPVVWWLQPKATVCLAARLAQTLSGVSPALPTLLACSTYPCLPCLQAWCIICTCPAACCNRCLPRPTFVS